MLDPDVPLASLSLTHVHYNPADRISYLCAWLALVPQGLCIVYASLIWSTREVEIILMFAGQMGCEALNWCLKRYIKEERPRQMYGKGYGMPSSHAQFVAFFSLYLALFLLLRHTPQPAPGHAPIPLWQRAALSLLALAAAAAVAASRIYLMYHTPRQVAVGAAAGAACAAAWFVAVAVARRAGLVDAVLLESWAARALRLRDLVLTEDLADAGWGRWQERRRRGKRAGRATGGNDGAAAARKKR